MIRKLKIIAIVSMILLSSFIFVSVNVSAAIEIIQPSSQDAYIKEFTNSGDGSSGLILVYPNPGHRFRTLVQFDLSSIPSGSTVTSAVLKLYYYPAAGDPSGRTYRAYRLTKSWTEMGVSWNQYDGTNAWSTPGGDYSPLGLSSSTVPSSSGWMTWTVTAIVNAWVSGSPNYGFLIKDYNEDSSTDQSNFYSREWSEASQRPILEITYSEPLVPTIESAVFNSPSSWVATDTFSPGDDVCVVGDGFLPGTTYDVQVVNDVDWIDGMTIPSYVAKTVVTTDDMGEIMDAVPVWNDATPGKYDIIVDVNDSGEYEASIDALDDSDIEVTAGFFVEPFSREALWNRLVEIILAWPTSTPEEREELWEDIVEIILLWPTAP